MSEGNDQRQPQGGASGATLDDVIAAIQQSASTASAAGRDPEPVPYAQFRGVVKELGVLRGQVKTLSEKADAAAPWEGKYTQAVDSHKAEVARLRQDLALSSRLGGPPESREEALAVARFHYERVPEADRPKDIGVWFDQFTREEDPVTAPASLAPFLPGSGSGGGTGRATQKGDGVVRKGPNPAGGEVTVEQLEAAQQRAQREGSEEAWKEVDRLTATLEAQARGHGRR